MGITYEILNKTAATAVASSIKTRVQTKTNVKPKTGKPIAAGMLDIIVSTWMIIGTTVIFAHEQPDSSFLYFALICILISMFSLTAGICAFTRRGWELSLIGSICAIPFIYGIISTILIVQSKNEFSNL